MQTVTKQKLLALENAAILYQAQAAGLSVRTEDLFVNYAEIHLTLDSKEDRMVEKVRDQIQAAAHKWLSQISDPGDLDPDDLDLESIFETEILDHVRSVWRYGSEEAAKELERMEIAKNSEVSWMSFFAAGVPSTDDDLWNDAAEWYQNYSQKLAASAKNDLFIRMQPEILENIKNGTVRLNLADQLASEFARFGAVRADVIARTESSKAFNWGRRYRFDGSAALGGYRYSAIMDERTTPICRGLHGHSWEKGDPDLDDHTPPNHFRCRSILVPISKYTDYSFEPPDDDYLDQMDDLSDKEKKSQKAMLNKFKDSTFYPKRSGSVVVATKVKDVKVQKVKTPAAPVVSDAKLKEFVDHSNEAAARYYEGLVEHNLKRGLSKSHPSIVAWQNAADEIRAGKYKDKVIMAEWNARAANKVSVKEFQRDGGVFVRFDKVNKADRDRVQKEIDIIKNDPLFAGVKLEYKNSKTLNGSYRSSDDYMMMNVNSRGLQTLYHEVGHRVHANPTLYNTSYNSIFRKNEINITPGTWDKWQQQTEKWWEPGRTPLGSTSLPSDLKRFEYPINAKYYYKNGTKANYYKEMFAETTSVYLEGDPAEIAKVRKTYPGLLEFMEKEVFKRGVIK